MALTSLAASMPRTDFRKFLRSPRGAVGIIGLLILGVEFLIMVLIELVFKPMFDHQVASVLWEFLDPILLTMIVAPGIYVFAVLLEKQQLKLQQQFNELSIAAVTFDSREGVIVTDVLNNILKVNHSFTEITGYSNKEAVGKTPAMLHSGRQDKEFYRNMWKVLERDRFWSGEIWNRRKNGEIYPEWLAITAVLGADGQVTNFVGIFSDITERKNSEQQLHELTAHIQTVREEEKTRIAREIHDALGGKLTALKMETYWLSGKLSGNPQAAPLLEHVDSMTQLIDRAVHDIRRIITDLRPTILDDLGLVAALEWQCGQFHKRTGIACNIISAEDEGDAGKVNKIQATNLFRIFQEALTNVLQHSAATRVDVEFHERNERITLSVSDNGRGLSAEQAIASTSYGMRGMRERVAQLNGQINFDSPPGGGFRLTVVLPIADDQPMRGNI